MQTAGKPEHMDLVDLAREGVGAGTGGQKAEHRQRSKQPATAPVGLPTAL